MSTVVIPTRTDGTQRYAQQCTLNGVRFTLEFLWNARESSWSMQVSDAAGDLLLAKKIVLDQPMRFRYMDPRLPGGDFIAVDTSGAQVEPGLTDLGSRVLLTFTDIAGIVAAIG